MCFARLLLFSAGRRHLSDFPFVILCLFYVCVGGSQAWGGWSGKPDLTA